MWLKCRIFVTFICIYNVFVYQQHCIIHDTGIFRQTNFHTVWYVHVYFVSEYFVFVLTAMNACTDTIDGNLDNYTNTNKNEHLLLTHWCRVTQLCVGKLTIIGSENGLSPGRRQAIIWINARILLIGTLWTNFSEILIEIPIFPFKKMQLKMSTGKWRPFCLGLNVLTGNPFWQISSHQPTDGSKTIKWKNEIESYQKLSGILIIRPGYGSL